MNEPHDIDALLARRAAPRAPHDLADRIVYRAVRTPQAAASPAWRAVLGECLSFLVIPRPALAFGFCLMIGLFSGWATTQDTDAGDSTAEVLNMFVIEEGWL